MAEEPANQELPESMFQEHTLDPFAHYDRKFTIRQALVGMERPVIKSPIDRFIAESKFLHSIEAPGILGRSTFPMNKLAVFRGEENIYMATQPDFVRDVKADGLFSQGAQQVNYNIQRREQRFLRQKQLMYFDKSNMKLRYHSDVTTHHLSKPTDMSLERNPAIDLKTVSAVLSHRNNSMKTKYFRLDLHIGSIQFTTHPQFIEEDILANALEKRYNEYENRAGLGLTHHLQDRIDNLRILLTDKQEEYSQINQMPTTSEQERLKILQNEIDLLEKHLSDAEAALQQESLSLQDLALVLYDKWQELKTKRGMQKFASTRPKLMVRQYNEAGRDSEYDFFLKQHKVTGENETEGIAIPRVEKNRRMRIEGSRYFIRIRINGQYVARTEKRFLIFPQFKVNFNQCFQLHLFTRPVSIAFDLCTGFTFTKTIATFDFAPPGLNVNSLTSTPTAYKQVDFISPGWEGKATMMAHWEGSSHKMPPVKFADLASLRKKVSEIPTNVDFLIDVNDPRNEALVEYLKVKRSEYIIDILAKDALFPHQKFTSRRQLLMKNKYRSLDISKLPVPMYERDIKNSPILMDFLDNMKSDEKFIKNINFFFLQRCKLQYSLDEEAKERMKSLMLYFIMKQNQIGLGSRKTLHALEAIVKEYVAIETKYFLMCWKFLFTPRRKLLPKRNAIKLVSQKGVRQSMLKVIVYKGVNIPVRLESHSQRYAATSRFYTPKLPNTMPNTIGKPMGENYPAETYDNQFQRSYHDYAGHPPSQPRQFQPEQRAEEFKVVERVLCFVEVRLLHNGRSTTMRTAAFEGVNPEWNELLEFTFNSLNDEGFKLDEMLESESVLYFNLFDQRIRREDVFSDPNDLHYRLNRRFLGSFSLPLLTVFQNPEGVEASMKIKRPLSIIGYVTSTAHPFKDDQNQQEEVRLDPEISTYVSLKVTLDPSLSVPVESEGDYYPGYERPEFLFDSFQWAVQLRNKYSVLKNRRILLWAENTDGQSVFLPRFLSALEPPPGLLAEGEIDKVAKVARFVSMIPHIEDSKAFKDLPDLWSDCQQFLDLGFGDFEEHAILLCNYFMWVDRRETHIQHYLVIGNGVPEGNTVYVMRRDSNTGHFELWDSSNGIGFSFINQVYQSMFLCIPVASGKRAIPQDSELILGLKSVSCLVDINDVYINIQKYSDPYSISFDVLDTKCWVHFLGTSKKRTDFFGRDGINKIQKPLLYEEIRDEFIHNIQLELEGYLTKAFIEARVSGELKKPAGTNWDYEASLRIGAILPKLEHFCCSYRHGAHRSSLFEAPEDESKERLNSIHREIMEAVGTNYAYGFPINKPLTTFEAIWEEIQNTDLHNIAGDDHKFILTVRVFPYSCYICSVWIYIGVKYNEAYLIHDNQRNFYNSQPNINYYDSLPPRVDDRMGGTYQFDNRGYYQENLLLQ